MMRRPSNIPTENIIPNIIMMSVVWSFATSINITIYTVYDNNMRRPSNIPTENIILNIIMMSVVWSFATSTNMTVPIFIVHSAPSCASQPNSRRRNFNFWPT